MKKVGIIGGMGPLASIDLYKKIVDLTKAKTDQDNIPLIIDNNTLIPDRASFIMGKSTKNPLSMLVNSAKFLKNSGCEAVCMACNTAHFFADEIIKQSGANLLHIAKICVSSLNKNFLGAKNIAVLATTGTIKFKIYDNELEKFGFNSVEISQSLQNELMNCIYDGVKAGKIDEYVRNFENIINTIKADIYLTACTELPIFLPLIKSDKIFVDPTTELAKAVIEFSKGQI